MGRKIITLLLLFAVFTVNAQEKESLNLFTDRDLYISGETLLLKVFAPAGEQSGIVNIDLMNRKGKKITSVILEIINHQAVAFKLADMATEIEAARLLVYKAALLKDQHKNYDMASAMAKVFASEVAMKNTNASR